MSAAAAFGFGIVGGFFLAAQVVFAIAMIAGRRAARSHR